MCAFFRTKKIRWIFVIQYFAEFVLAIFYYIFILERLVAPVIRTYRTWSLEPMWFIKIIIEMSIPGILFFINSHYLLLHAWMNAWAEMLRFADRLFYKASFNYMIARLSLTVPRSKKCINYSSVAGLVEFHVLSYVESYMERGGAWLALYVSLQGYVWDRGPTQQIVGNLHRVLRICYFSRIHRRICVQSLLSDNVDPIRRLELYSCH